MGERPYVEMTDDELRAELATWTGFVEEAAGWPSAHFAAKQLEAVCKVANGRGLGFTNPYPIRIG